jgi:hypothetical protein
VGCQHTLRCTEILDGRYDKCGYIANAIQKRYPANLVWRCPNSIAHDSLIHWIWLPEGEISREWGPRMVTDSCTIAVQRRRTTIAFRPTPGSDSLAANGSEGTSYDPRSGKAHRAAKALRSLFSRGNPDDLYAMVTAPKRPRLPGRAGAVAVDPRNQY